MVLSFANERFPGKEFTVSDGGGVIFHLLHCDKCGEEKSIAFDEIGEPHLRYIKGLDVPYCIATAERNEDVQEEILFLPRTTQGRNPIPERHLRPIAAILDWHKQRKIWQEVKRDSGI